MYTVPPKKNLILNILDILKKYSDENHRLSAREIGDILRREYAQTADRKAIKRNLINLLDFGYRIEFSETVRKKKNGEEETLYSDWYLSREFTDPELRLLIDSLLFQSISLIINVRKSLRSWQDYPASIFTPGAAYPQYAEQLLEQELFYIIDVLDEAIQTGKMVAFRYTEYGGQKPRPRKAKMASPGIQSQPLSDGGHQREYYRYATASIWITFPITAWIG